VTSSNELTRPDGAAVVLDNCVIDFDNIVEPRRGFGEFGNSTDNEAIIKQLITYKGRIIRHFADKLSFDSTGNGTFLNFSGSYNELVERLRIKYFELNSNLYFTTSEGIKKISAKSANDFSTSSGYITDAGGVKAVSIEGRITPNAAGFLPAQSKVGYRIVWAKKDANGNVIRGVPSSRLVVTNTSKNINVGESFSLKINTDGGGIHKSFDSTTSVAGSTITINNHGYANNTVVQFYGTLPEEIDKNLLYRVLVTDPSNFQICLDSDGTNAPITLTDAVGTGFIYSGINNSHYFYFETPVSKYGVWFDISGESVAPTVGEFIGRDLLKIPLNELTIKNNVNYATKIAEVLSRELDIQIELEVDTITITNVDEGNVLDANQGNIPTSLALVSKILDGQTSQGTPANVNLTFLVPSGITTKDYFYEVYRTAIVTAQEGLISLEDLDPGEEFQKVYEAPVASNNDPIPSEITVEDLLEDSFREVGPFLYTNPISGESILQANEAPPVALDVAVFKNSAFYANTKERHKLQLTLLSPSQFVSESSKLIIANSNIVREYTFVGENQQIKFTTKKKSETVGNSYFDIPTAQNKITYRVWFDKGIIQKSFTIANMDIVADTITVTNHSFATNDLVTISGTTTLPTGEYYVIRVDQDTIQLKLTLTSLIPVDFTVAEAGNITHTPSAPAQNGAVLLRVILETYADTAVDTANAFKETFFDIFDFDIPEITTNEVILNYTDNGEANNVTTSAISPGWDAVVYINLGKGENASNNEVFLSGSASEGIAIEDTARSLERVINKDPLSPVNAFYISGVTDLPGKLLLESKTLEDIPFYLGFSDSTITPVFDPSLPVVKTILDITPASPDPIIKTSVNHDFAVGQTLFAFIKPTLESILFSGTGVVQDIFSGTDTLTLSGLEASIFYDTFDNAIIFPAEVVSDNSVNPNRIYFSKIGQPEAVPSINYIDIGPKDQPIQRIMALRDSLIILKQDGVYVLTGPAAPNFSVRLSDSSALTFAPDTAVNLNNLIYVLTSQGVVTVSETGVSVISRNIEDKIQEITNVKYNYKLMSWGISSESERSYMLFLPEKIADSYATQAYRYNTFTRSWTRWTKPANCGVVNPLNDKIYFGDSLRPYVLQERKNFERQDYADRELSRSIGVNSVNKQVISISSVDEVTVGDVLTQRQYLDINKFNRTLKKLDRDGFNLNPTKYITLKANIGDNLSSKVNELASKLQADGVMVPSPVGINIPEDVRDDFNDIINYLNLSSSGTNFKNYKTVTEELVYEALITKVDRLTNTITVNFIHKFLEGPISIFKGIKCVVEYAPQHFGKPEVTKQVAQGTFIFDQNNFWGGTIAYSSDRSYDFASVNFSLKGPGYWDGYTWADVTFGGEGNEVPVRTLIPRDKSRCRYLHIQFTHINAREKFKLIGVSLEPREVSTRGYR
jgi:hypothetical protein